MEMRFGKNRNANFYIAECSVILLRKKQFLKRLIILFFSFIFCKNKFCLLKEKLERFFLKK